MEGTPFGRYRLIDMLGRGGMGEVWRAWDTETKRTVAIKVLPPYLANDNEFVQRFRREAEAAAQLNSPHVIPIHHYGEIDGRLYVDMRLIDGRDLGTLLAEGPLEPARAVHIIDQVAKALHAAHRVGLVHRDIKPTNILVDDDDFAYLIDFGIARAADETRMTKSGYTIGTFQYIAPERLDSQIEEDARADIYSLACVLYEALTGEPPFAGSAAQLMFAHINSAPPRPSATQPDVPPQVDEVIATGMAKDPNQRYATTVELAHAAREAVTEPILRPTPSPPSLPATEQAPLPPTQRAENRVEGQPTTLKAEPLASARVAPPQPVPPRPTSTGGISRRTTIALIVGAMALVAVIALAVGIPALVNQGPSESSPTSSSPPTPSTTIPSAAAISTSESVRSSGATDFTSLLIQPSDVGPDAVADGPPSQNPSGITGVGRVFKNPDGRRTIVDTVAVFPDAATAAQTAANMKDVVTKKVSGQQQPIDIGSSGFMVIGQGTDPANPMEISEAVFVEGRVMVDLESDCVIGNPTPSSVLLDLARKQDATVKNGVPA
jgi:serine/threonine-protein kinase